MNTPSPSGSRLCTGLVVPPSPGRDAPELERTCAGGPPEPFPPPPFSLGNARVITLDAALPVHAPSAFTDALRAWLGHQPGLLPLDDHCRSGGTAQDAVVGGVMIDRCDATEVNGTLELAFTEVLPVGCADIRLYDPQRIIVRFRYRPGWPGLEIERGFPAREYDPEEF